MCPVYVIHIQVQYKLLGNVEVGEDPYGSINQLLKTFDKRKKEKFHLAHLTY